jgi:hypothetical protein
MPRRMSILDARVAREFCVGQTSAAKIELPTLLKTNEDETAVYFFKQPEGDAETAAAHRSMEVCPTLAIGNDG